MARTTPFPCLMRSPILTGLAVSFGCAKASAIPCASFSTVRPFRLRVLPAPPSRSSSEPQKNWYVRDGVQSILPCFMAAMGWILFCPQLAGCHHPYMYVIAILQRATENQPRITCARFFLQATRRSPTWPGCAACRRRCRAPARRGRRGVAAERRARAARAGRSARADG